MVYVEARKDHRAEEEKPKSAKKKDFSTICFVLRGKRCLMEVTWYIHDAVIIDLLMAGAKIGEGTMLTGIRSTDELTI